MYDAGQLYRGLARGLRNPGYVGRQLNRLYHRRGTRRSYNTDGTDLMAEEWDTLVILDACRYDTFAELSTLSGHLETRQSRGSHTVEFLRGNVADRRLHDTVYVTASPQLYRHRTALGAEFHAVDHVWHGAGWDESAGTVRPETVTERALAAREEYPNKRLLVHYMQPHYPFLGGPQLSNRDLRRGEGLDVWAALARGRLDVSADRVRAAYRRNLALALPAVEELLAATADRAVVTADHGNMFGERARPLPVREWGHPSGLYTEQLVQVPWLVRPGERRRITPAPPAAGSTETEAATPTEQLRSLGYVE
jgi:hypothetical protein